MKDIYNYQENITITTTPNGDKVITMNDAILTMICNTIWEGGEHQDEDGRDATAKETLKLWTALTDKKEQSNK